MGNDKKKKLRFSNFATSLVLFAIGALCGWLLMKYGISEGEGEIGFGKRFLLVLASLIFAIISIIVHIILHELGHMVFGLISGYKFSSFRVFSFMWLKSDGKIEVKRLSIAGTAGQCLMSPPDMRDGKLPVVLYTFGGVIMNLLVSSAFLAAWFAIPPIPVLKDAIFIFALVGYLLGLMNGLPVHTAVIDNDGYNAIALARSFDARRAFWIQMKINEEISRGVRLKDMPDEWFVMPGDDAMKNSMVAATAVFACNRMMDAGRFEEADSAMQHVLKIDSGIVGLHRALLVYDRIFVELIGENRRTAVEALRSEQIEKIADQMKNFPSVIRTRYAIALLHDKNDEEAERILAHFNYCASRYPYKSDIDSERELIEAARSANANK